jgi:hypothetical protein
MTRISLFLCLAFLSIACGTSEPQQQTPTPAAGSTPAEARGQKAPETPKETEAEACYKVDTGDKAVLRSQTFAIDFEPFKGSCFVTSHDPEFKDPPLGSEYSIYRDGKRVFIFPNQFNGVQVGCWVAAVAFQDVNSDGRTDVIVVGRCGGKSGSFHENSVYVNDGRSFITREDINLRLADFRSLGEIIEHLKRNPQYFTTDGNASDSNR